MSLAEEWAAKRQARYDAEVARGEHDTECEQAEQLFMCHCSKRKREREGFTELPGELIWNEPSCPKCWSDCWHDGDSWVCPKCPVTWDSSGHDAQWTDDHGDAFEQRRDWGRRLAPRVSTVETTGGVL